MGDYEARRDAHIASLAANIVWDYLHNIKPYEGKRDQQYLTVLMKNDLESLARLFKGFEHDFGL